MLKFAKPDKARKEQVEKERQEEFDACVAAAQNCLRLEQFQKYRKHFERAEKLAIDNLYEIDRVIDDPNKYAFAVKDILARLSQIRLLNVSVESDMGKR